MYRWVDENGEVHYTDQVPPSQVKQGHTRLSEEGLRIETLPPAPTEEELRRAEEQERREAEEARRLEAQKAADRRLSRKYRTIEDLAMARDGKVAAIDALIQVKRDEVRLEQERLLALHAELKRLEGTSKAAPQKLRDDIADRVLRIRDGYGAIIDQEFRKQEVRQEFDQIMARYRRIRGLPEPGAENAGPAWGTLLPNLVSCEGVEQCGREWERALAYLRRHADAKDEIRGRGLLITLERDEREDRRLTLAWVQKSAEEPVYLFLDLQCRHRLTASLTCINKPAKKIRDGLRAAVRERGSSEGASQ